MIGVSIHINGTVIYARTAVNRGPVGEQGRCEYEVDDGSTVFHKQSDGAVALAYKLLDTIKEQKSAIAATRRKESE